MKELDEFFKSLETANKSIHTIRSYKKDAYKFIEYFSIKKVEEINGLKQSDYREFISNMGLSASSTNALIRNISVFLNWLEESEYISKSSFFKVKFGKSRYVKTEKKVKDVLNEEEIEKIISAGKNNQEKFMIALMVKTAIRRDEVSKIKISDIEGNRILIHGKGSKERNIYMNDELMKMYDVHIQTRKSNSDYLFTSGNHGISGVSINERVIKALNNAGIDKNIRAHGLRRTAITNIITRYDILTASKVAGHADISTTRIYDMSGDEMVKRALLG